MDMEKKALEEGEHSLYKCVGPERHVILRAEPSLENNDSGEFTLITPGTISIKGDNISEIHSGWNDVSEPQKSVHGDKTYSRMSWANHKQIDAFVESIINKYDGDTTANDFIIEKRV